LKTDPITYKIKDMNTNETILGTFYELEMSKYNDDLYEIEKVVQTNKNKVLVKWKGYNTTSWINKKDIVNI
jgi:uncharacterized protein YacL (UPF0231 family)